MRLTPLLSTSLLAPAVLVACKEPPRETSPPTDAGIVALVESGASASCGAKVAQLEATLAAGGACAADADCKCFSGGLSLRHGCGGVTDLATSTKVDAITSDFTAAGCRRTISCAAWQCSPICENRRCMNGPRAPAAR